VLKKKDTLRLSASFKRDHFGPLAGAKCRYFFTGSFTRKVLGQEPVTIFIRVEQDNNAKTFEFDCPTSLASNLLWFLELRQASEASALRQVET
jgi:hypothetical protein